MWINNKNVDFENYGLIEKRAKRNSHQIEFHLPGNER